MPRPCAEPAVAKPRAMGSEKPNRFSSAWAKLAPSRPVRQTPAATIGAGAPSCAAIGSASATVMLRGTSALARSGRQQTEISAWHDKHEVREFLCNIDQLQRVTLEDVEQFKMPPR